MSDRRSRSRPDYPRPGVTGGSAAPDAGGGSTGADGEAATPPASSPFVDGLERVPLERTRPSALYAFPERDGVRPVLPAEPMVALDAGGHAVLSVVALLERRPSPDEADVEALVREGTLQFEATLALPEAVLEDRRCATGTAYEPAYTRRTTFRLARPDGTTLASADATGANPTAPLAATLPREDVLAVLAAVDGRDADLRLSASVVSATESGSRTLAFAGNWATIHDGLDERFGPDEPIEGGALAAAVAELVREGRLSVAEGGDALAGQEAAAPAVVDAFRRLAGVVLERGADGALRLRARPDERFDLDATVTVPSEGERTLTLETRLADAFGVALADQGRDRYVSFATLSGDRGSLARGVPPSREVSGAGRSVGSAVERLAATDGELTSVAFAVAPSGELGGPSRAGGLSGPKVHALDERRRLQALDDLRFVDRSIIARPVPFVEDPEAMLWPERAHPDRFVYAPTFEPVEPSPSDVPAEAPFSFTYEQDGTTASGEPALRGTVRIDLRETMPAAVEAALGSLGDPFVRPVEKHGLQVEVGIPFLDDDETRIHWSRATTERNGDGTLTAEVELQNEWVRLCYGALAYENFQARPPAVLVTYSHEAVVPVPDDGMVLLGGKQALTPVRYDRPTAVEGTAVFDASTTTLHTAHGSLALARSGSSDGPDVDEPDEDGTDADEPDVDGPDANGPDDDRSDADGTGRSGTAPLLHATSLATTAVRPEMVYRPRLVRPEFEVMRPKPTSKYAVRTFQQESRSDLSYPCDRVGSLYRQRIDGAMPAVGCREAFRLGETDYRQYEEVTDLRADAFRVFRSLPQPNRFLVLPTTYRIARYDPGTSWEYRPCARVYALLTEGAEENRFVLEAALQPAIPAYRRRRLGERLAEFAPDPQVEYPTALMEGAAYTWSIEDAISDPVVVEREDGLHVTVSTDLAQALLLKELLERGGVFGRVTFAFADGTTLASDVAMELAEKTGPWAGGPVESTLADGTATLANRVETTVDVSDVDVYGEGARRTVAVDATLEPGATTRIDVGSGSGGGGSDDDAVPVYTARPAPDRVLAETRIFVEDVETNVVFAAEFDPADHGIDGLSVEARLQGIPETYETALTGDPPVGTVELALPHTTYLDRHVLEYRVRKQPTEGAVETTDWRPWDLSERGAIVLLTEGSLT